MINISRCKKPEIQEVMSFIENHWQKSHVLATSRVLMDWQHGASDGTYDYLVARDSKRILGVLGYIASRRFDPSQLATNVIWLALWKIAEDAGVAGLGLRMLDSLGKLEPHVALAVNGINLAHPPMYRALRYEVGELFQYFVTCPGRAQTLVSAPANYSWPVPLGAGALWEEMRECDLLKMAPSVLSAAATVHKTATYFLNRFLRHPIYRYRVFLLTGSGGEQALVASRVSEWNDARVLRIVDFSGEPMAFRASGQGLARLMEESGAEYADFWTYGMGDDFIRPTGMTPVDPFGPVVVPNYFEPFIARNGRIMCAVKRMNGAALPTMIFRADGDQDRPNLIQKANT